MTALSDAIAKSPGPRTSWTRAGKSTKKHNKEKRESSGRWSPVRVDKGACAAELPEERGCQDLELCTDTRLIMRTSNYVGSDAVMIIIWKMKGSEFGLLRILDLNAPTFVMVHSGIYDIWHGKRVHGGFVLWHRQLLA